MKLDVEHVLFWMDAIRNSDNKLRTLESFWKGQIYSKIWLIENLVNYIDNTPHNVVIHGGWNGVLASLLFQSNIPINKIYSIDIDPCCEDIANNINKKEDMEGRFKSITIDMSEYNYDIEPDIVINTSCEHITQDCYNIWLSKIPKKTIIVLQSNNYKIDEHIRIADNLIHFEDQSKIDIIYSQTLKLPKYDRYMIIGKRYV